MYDEFDGSSKFWRNEELCASLFEGMIEGMKLYGARWAPRDAAIKIQSLFRGYKVRKYINREMISYILAARQLGIL